MKFKDDVASANGDSTFLKLKNHKDSIEGVFRGDPYEFKTHWVGKQSQICKGKDCEECSKGNKPSFRFAINFVCRDKETGAHTAKVWEQGSTVYRTLKDINDEIPLEKTILKITRNGTTKDDTSYTIVQSIGKPFSPEIEKVVSMVKLHDLESLVKKSKEEQQPMDAPFQEGDIPF